MNNDHIEDYKTATDTVRYSEDFNRKVEQSLAQSLGGSNGRYRPGIRRFTRIGIAAAVMAVLITAVCLFAANRSRIDLPDSQGVRAGYVGSGRIPDVEHCFIQMTEREIIDKGELIVSGEVSGIKNIEIDFGGRHRGYAAIVTVRVNEILRGEYSDGYIDICVPGGVGNMFSRSTDEVSSQLHVGGRAIFAAMRYNEDSFIMMNGNTFYYTDICEWGVFSEYHSLIVETDEGLAMPNNVWGFGKDAGFDDAVAYLRDATAK